MTQDEVKSVIGCGIYAVVWLPGGGIFLLLRSHSGTPPINILSEGQCININDTIGLSCLRRLIKIVIVEAMLDIYGVAEA